MQLLKSTKHRSILKYKLFTKNKEIKLNISKKDSEKILILEYIKAPFFILTYKNIDNEISINDSFEISNDEATLDLECESSCGINFKKKELI